MDSEKSVLLNEKNIENSGNEGRDNDPDGIDVKTKKSATKTKTQLEKMVSFVQIYGDFTQGKPSENLLAAWETLTEDLNEMGPPYHSDLEWRKVWSDHKGNRNRKRKSSSSSGDAVKPKALKANESGSRYIEVQRSNQFKDDKEIEISHSIINKLNTIVGQQNETNALLRELVDIFKPQSIDDAA